MNLVLIGNGFDRAHDLKTSYKEFIEHLGELFNKEPKKNKLFYGYRKAAFDSSFEITGLNEIISRATSDTNPNWYDIETAYFDLLQETDDPIELNKQLIDLKNALEEYLKTETKECKPIDGYNKIFESIGKDLIAINFNYTSTLEHYEHHFKEVINIHGSIDDPDNPMIFGYAADTGDTIKLLNKKNDDYIANIKQYEYLNTNNYRRLLSLITTKTYSYPVINVFIMGHSCGLSDQLILKQIMGGKGIRNIYNFYHKGMPDHKIKLINLNRTINEDLGFLKYVSFPDSLRMPQYDNDITKEEIDTFLIKYKANNKPHVRAGTV